MNPRIKEWHRPAGQPSSMSESSAPARPPADASVTFVNLSRTRLLRKRVRSST